MRGCARARTLINHGHFRRLFWCCHVPAGRGGRTGRGLGAGARFGLAAPAVERLLELPLAERRRAADGRHLDLPRAAKHHEKGRPPLHGRPRPDHLRRRCGGLGHHHPRRPHGNAAPEGALRGGRAPIKLLGPPPVVVLGRRTRDRTKGRGTARVYLGLWGDLGVSPPQFPSFLATMTTAEGTRPKREGGHTLGLPKKIP